MCASVFAFFVSLTASYILSLGKTQIEFGFALDLSLYLTASYILLLGRTQINLVLPLIYAYICSAGRIYSPKNMCFHIFEKY